MDAKTLVALEMLDALDDYLGRIEGDDKGSSHTINAITAEIKRQAAELVTLRAENASLKTVMIAAAEEIHAHWDAHCDAEGYGPQNLMRRLEEGIPSEYGYIAGAFESLRAEVAALRADAERWRAFLATRPQSTHEVICAAIDAARVEGGILRHPAGSASTWGGDD